MAVLAIAILSAFLFLQMKEEELRIEEGEEETRKRLKATREHHKAWEDKRETRVSRYCRH